MIEKAKFATRYPKVGAIQLRAKIRRARGKLFDPEGVDICNADWDTLLILDACRYDVFKQDNIIPGELSRVRSRGSTSQEWIRGNFTDRHRGDIVIVTANPWYQTLADETDMKICDFAFVAPDDDDSARTPPERVVNCAIDLMKKYPNKRFIIHFMQPHAPYLGETGRLIEFDNEQLQKTVRKNHISTELIKKAYRENFQIVQRKLKKILEFRGGKTVISADHGELLGEPLIPTLNLFSFYGHPYGINHPVVRNVPWHIVAHDESERINVESGKVQPVNKIDRGTQLRALGYL